MPASVAVAACYGFVQIDVTTNDVTFLLLPFAIIETIQAVSVPLRLLSKTIRSPRSPAAAVVMTN